MGRPAKRPAEFRRDAVALVKSSGRPVAEVARSLEIPEGTLRNWAKLDREATERAAGPDALSESERAELSHQVGLEDRTPTETYAAGPAG
jgi:transposase